MTSLNSDKQWRTVDR